MQNEFGSTLYHVTAEEDYFFQSSALKILVENAADPLIKDHKGMVAGAKLDSLDPRKRLLQRAMHEFKHKKLQKLSNLEHLRKLVQDAIQIVLIRTSDQIDSRHKEMPISKATSASSMATTMSTTMSTSTSQTQEQTSNGPVGDTENEGEITEAAWTVPTFEDLSLEVKCSAEVKDLLHAKDVPDSTKQQIVQKIRYLAEGRRTEKLCKKLHPCSHAGIQLFEARVTQGQRIIWQQANDFSPRFEAYSPTIRIWRICKHDHVDSEARKIANSLRAPTSGTLSTLKEGSEILLPVESSENKEYHVVKKFYPMTSYMINNVRSGIHDVEYPFDVTPLECEMIKLNPECSIILLGRSGTGKTTCCLFRLWKEYHDFQQKALTAGVQEEVGDCMQFHQIFISRNKILCGEIAKMFHSFQNAHYTPKNDLPASPLRFQDAREDSWPLFLSVFQWLMMLDASLPGKTFFPREHGELRCSIKGMDHENRVSLNSCLNDKADGEATVAKTRVGKNTKQEIPEANNEPVYTMVTYEVFTSTLWPKMVRRDTKKQPTLHPTLVWTEIMSFIKGSADALESGELNLEEYQNVGKKMAPNFRSNREDIYELYRKYKDLKKSRLMFDECDLVHNVYRRLQHAPQLPVDQFYVDEAQDLTQAELFLLIHCCRDSNGLFFSGDTAQSIMKGVSFRFADLKSLFYRESLQRTVIVPNQIYHLTCNYRSHSGIVDLASSVVGLLQHFFPISFDRLAKEQGLFPGPKPVLIDSSNFAYLAKLLKGQKRESTPIELGAQQVVLVASEKARDSVPEELREGLVMTVYEAKGLEFDDVLIFNFFKESEVRSA